MPAFYRPAGSIRRIVSLYGLGLVSGIGLSGCGGGAPTAPSGSAAALKSEKPAATAAAETTSDAADSGSVRTDTQGGTCIVDIPYDVFFDDPLAVVANTNTVAVATPTATPGAMPAQPATPSSDASAAPATGGGVDWKSMITIEQINDEAKRIRNHLTASLQSQGTYNGNYQDLQVDGAVVAALAEIVAKHPGDVSWKENTRFLRSYGVKLKESATGLGRDAYDASQVAAEGIIAVFNGNLPADAGDPPATAPFGEVASRSGVMKRIRSASEWMRANINSESVFEKEAEQIRSESTIIAVLGTVIADHSYDSADEEDYAGYAKNLIEAARESAAAAEEKAFPKFNEAMNKLQKACNECHADYGTG